MHSITTADLMAAWESGLSQPPVQRALVLLAIAFPQYTAQYMALLPIGERDRSLLKIREQLFGAKLLNTAICPECFEQLEWESQTSDFYAVNSTPPVKSHSQHKTDNSADPCSNSHQLTYKNYQVHFHAPTSLDVMAALNSENSHAALLSQCIERCEYKQKAIATSKIPDTVIQAISHEMEKLDPLAQINITLDCPACKHHWQVVFDIANFLWQEVHAWAQTILHSTHRLARAYGWSEQQILQLSPVRRQLYLSMLDA